MFEEVGRHLDNLVRRVTDSTGMTEIDPRTDTISIPYPDTTPFKLRLDIGVGKLNVTPGSERLVEGTATYNVAEWAPQTTVEGGNVALKQGQAWALSSVWGHMQNDWELKLGTTKPFELSIGKGVTAGALALGGIPLTGLSVDVGAAESRISFDRPNPERAGRMEFKCGAGETDITGLLNGNAVLAYVKGGAGKTHLGFTGVALKQDLTADVNLGVGEAIVDVKAGIPARVTIAQALGSIKMIGNFCQAGDRVYETPDFASASGPKLVMKISTGVGSVTVKSI